MAPKQESLNEVIQIRNLLFCQSLVVPPPCRPWKVVFERRLKLKLSSEQKERTHCEECREGCGGGDARCYNKNIKYFFQMDSLSMWKLPAAAADAVCALLPTRGVNHYLLLLWSTTSIAYISSSLLSWPSLHLWTKTSIRQDNQQLIPSPFNTTN